MGTAESPVIPANSTATTSRPITSDGNRMPNRNAGENASVAEIQTDIDRTRGEIDETLDALGNKLHPRHLLDDVIDMVRSKTGAGSGEYAETAKKLGRRAMCAIKDHPVPSLLIGAGLAWMLFEEDEDSAYERRFRRVADLPAYSGSYVDARTGEPYDLESYGHEWREGEAESREGWGDKARQAGATAKDKLAGAGESIRQAAGTARGAASSAAAKAGEWAGSAREGMTHMGHTAGRYGRRVRSGAGQVGQRAGEISRQAGHRVQEGYAYSRERFEDALDEYPLAVGVGFLAIGLLAGLALPRTRQEDEWMGEASDEMKDRARESAEELRERGMEAVQATTAAAQEEAQRQGLGAGDLVEKVKHVASEAMHAAKETAREEGIDPTSLKEKGQAVAQRTKEQGKQEAMHHQEEMRT